MARPIKHGLDYFPFDVDFFSDEKLYAISGEFGIKGEITTIKLLCAVYRNGYFIEWTEMLKFKLLKELPGVSPDLLDQIIKRLVRWDFFDKGLFDSASVLTSKGIQRRYQAISNKMHRKNAITDYCLIDDTKTAATKQEKTVTEPQKTTSPQQPAVNTPAPQKPNSTNKPVPLEESVSRMLSDAMWNEPVCMRYKLSLDDFKRKVQNFKLYCLSMEKKEHEDVKDAKRHFCTLLQQGKLEDVGPNKKTHTDASEVDYTYSGGFGSKDS